MTTLPGREPLSEAYGSNLKKKKNKDAPGAERELERWQSSSSNNNNNNNMSAGAHAPAIWSRPYAPMHHAPHPFQPSSLAGGAGPGPALGVHASPKTLTPAAQQWCAATW